MNVLLRKLVQIRRGACQLLVVLIFSSCGGGGGGGGGGTSESYSGSYQAAVVRQQTNCNGGAASESGTIVVTEDLGTVQVRLFQYPVTLVGFTDANGFTASGEFTNSLNCVEELNLTARPFEEGDFSELALQFSVTVRTCNNRRVSCRDELTGSATRIDS